MLGCKDENWFCQNQTLENHKKNVSNVNNNKKPDIHQTAKMLFFLEFQKSKKNYHQITFKISEVKIKDYMIVKIWQF